jgi:hypothetical protein
MSPRSPIIMPLAARVLETLLQFSTLRGDAQLELLK